jgi:methyl coenzyme M reductase alpha subunit
MEKYNGWTNYATWRVNLEIFDSMTAYDFDYDPERYDTAEESVYDIQGELALYAEELIQSEGSGLAVDYALAFLNDVNWKEIARAMVANAEENESC